MNVCIISYGKFHSFDLASGLKQNNCRISLHSSYPFFIAKKYKIKFNEYNSFFLLQLLDRLSNRKLSVYLKFLFAYLVMLNLFFKKRNHYDFFIIWSSTPNILLKFLKIKFKNSKIILERGSTHIRYQNEILSEEYSKFNKIFQIDKNLIENEILNYDISDYISIPSKFVYETFLKFGISKSKIFVNPYGVDLNKFHNINLVKNKFTIITVGGSSIRKGLVYVLNSHKYIKKKFRHIHVGNLDSEIKEIVKNFKNFKHVKSQSQSKLNYYYNLADIFILASIEEGLSLTIFEAMACGKPILATKNTGIESIQFYQNFSKTIDLYSSEDIADKINFLMNNKNQLMYMSNNAIKNIRKGSYSWTKYSKRYKGFLKKINNQN